jgi:3D (Asp-Asp-Asp) domain-containing protein
MTVLSVLLAFGLSGTADARENGLKISLTGARKIPLWATIYYTPVFWHDPAGIPLRGFDGRELGPRLSHRDWCAGAMQGSFMVVYGGHSNTYNVSGKSDAWPVDCSDCYRYNSSRSKFRRIDSRFGLTASGFSIVPYRSLAVDPSVIPIGTVLFIPAARGMKVTMPEGRVIRHDGLFFAADTGGKIRGNHIDVYTGTDRKSPFLAWAQSDPKNPVEAYVIADPAASAWLSNLHRGAK